MFSSLFLGTQIPNVAVIWKQAGPQLMYGMLIAWGQWIVALVVTGALLVRTPHSPNDYQHVSPKIISLTLKRCVFYTWKSCINMGYWTSLIFVCYGQRQPTILTEQAQSIKDFGFRDLDFPSRQDSDDQRRLAPLREPYNIIMCINGKFGWIIYQDPLFVDSRFWC